MVDFVVEGRPVPQGSMVASYNRKTETAHVHHVQGAALAAWRAAVRQAAREAGVMMSAAPIHLIVDFSVKRPKSQVHLKAGLYVPKPKYEMAMPTTAPDIDKLARAVMDALSGVAYHDDSQVVELLVTKSYGPARTHIMVEDASSANGQKTIW